MKKLTFNELTAACRKFDYLIVRTSKGAEIGLNGRLADIGIVKKMLVKKDHPTMCVSFRECSFMEYISKKTGFWPY